MIYKGCQKRMIVIREPSGTMFEEAYFVLRDDIPSRAAETDMVREANRIVRESLSGVDLGLPEKCGKRRLTASGLMWLLLGFASGVGASFLLFAAL